MLSQLYIYFVKFISLSHYIDKHRMCPHFPSPNCRIFDLQTKAPSPVRPSPSTSNNMTMGYINVYLPAKHYVVLSFMVMYYFRKLFDNLILILIILWNLYLYGTQILFECFCESWVEQRIILYSFCERWVFSLFFNFVLYLCIYEHFTSFIAFIIIYIAYNLIVLF